MTKASKILQEVEDDKRLEYGSRFVLTLGPLSNIFTTPIRVSQNAASVLQTDDAAKIRKFATDVLEFPFRISPTCRASLFFLLEEIRISELRTLSPLSHVSMIELADTDELSAVLALTYLYRIIRRRCDAEEWSRLMPKVSVHLQLGYQLGSALKGVGPGLGMFIAGLRIFSHALFLVNDLKGFKDIRRKSESRKKLFLCEEEEMKWGCNHLHIASSLASAVGLGFTKRLAFGLHALATSMSPQHTSEIDNSAPSIRVLRVLLESVESLHERGSLDSSIECAELQTVANELEHMANGLIGGEGGALWIHKTRDDLPEEIAELLRIPKKVAQEVIVTES